MTPPEWDLLEKFLQYGDLINANLIYMGFEEGVASFPPPHDVEISIEARRLLQVDPIYTPCRIFVNGINDTDGWYINEDRWNFMTYPEGPLAHAIRAATAGRGFHIPWNPPNVNVINMQTRLHWLLQNGNRTHNYIPHSATNYAGYNPRIGRHMIDFYPFPKRGKGSWDSILNVGPIIDINSYYDHYNTPGNNRWNIISNLYNLLPMNITVSYLGKSRGSFLLQNFYYHVGFTNFINLNTGVINPAYIGPIVPSVGGRDFLLGERIRPVDGHKQIVVLTPFFGMGQLSYEDIDAISTWI
jgi:hypothetical protein